MGESVSFILGLASDEDIAACASIFWRTNRFPASTLFRLRWRTQNTTAITANAAIKQYKPLFFMAYLLADGFSSSVS